MAKKQIPEQDSARLVTDLRYACQVGDMEAARRFLSLGQDINGRGNFGMTSLMLAAKYGHKELFDLLVSKGADLRLKNDYGDTILHLACRVDVEIVKYVLSQDIEDMSINSKKSGGLTPVLWATLKGQRKLEVVEFLVAQGADVSLVDNKGNNILHLAAKVM